MISVETVGVSEVIARFDRLSDRMTEELRAGISRLSIQLQGRVKSDFLSGQSLGVQTGRGKRSIQQDVQVSGNAVSGVVSTNVDYMIGWETGWPGSAQEASLTAAKAKFDPAASADTFKNGTPKKRAFLVPALKALQESGAIQREIDAAIARAAK